MILARDGVTLRSTSAVGNPFMYTSRRFDVDTGLYYFRARYYDSAQGRFISRDPIDYGSGENGTAVCRA
jgi:RHS repeat-associated protein